MPVALVADYRAMWNRPTTKLVNIVAFSGTYRVTGSEPLNPPSWNFTELSVKG